jgi:hypothetical protein
MSVLDRQVEAPVDWRVNLPQYFVAPSLRHSASPLILSLHDPDFPFLRSLISSF